MTINGLFYVLSGACLLWTVGLSLWAVRLNDS